MKLLIFSGFGAIPLSFGSTRIQLLAPRYFRYLPHLEAQQMDERALDRRRDRM
jgi:hypothetical protein